MSEPSDNAGSRMFSTDETDVVTYRVVSKFAIVSAVLGGFSFTAVLHPLLLVIPVAATVTAILALREVAVSTSGITGRWLAVVGVTLAVLFGSTAMARLISRDLILTARAKRFADDWLKLVVAGRHEEAFEMTLPPIRRQLPGTDLKKFYSSRTQLEEAEPGEEEGHGDRLTGTEHIADLQHFFSKSPVSEIVSYGADDTLSYQEIYTTSWSSYYGDLVSLRYELEYVAEDETKTADIYLVVQRKRHKKKGHGQWMVHQVGGSEEED